MMFLICTNYSVWFEYDELVYLCLIWLRYEYNFIFLLWSFNLEPYVFNLLMRDWTVLFKKQNWLLVLSNLQDLIVNSTLYGRVILDKYSKFLLLISFKITTVMFSWRPSKFCISRKQASNPFELTFSTQRVAASCFCPSTECSAVRKTNGALVNKSCG